MSIFVGQEAALFALLVPEVGEVQAEPSVFAFVEDMLKKLGAMINVPIQLKGHNLLIFHSVVFAILMGLSVKYVFEPIFYSNNGLFK